MNKILCLDLGNKTGWAINQAEIIVSGTIELSNGRMSRFEGGGMRFLRFTQFLDEIFTKTRFSEIRYEEVRRHLGTDAAHLYGGYLAHLSAWCEQKNIPYSGVPVGSIKKFVTGKGNASKALVMDAIKAKGHQPRDDNEADAIALLLCVSG